VDVGGEVAQISAGSWHTCALLKSGALRCWGEGVLLGYPFAPTIGDDETPASAGDVNVGGSVVQVAAGNLHTCALLSTGRVRCWGEGAHGALGYGNSFPVGVPAFAGDVNVGGIVKSIAVGTAHTCALLDTGKVRCWGNGANGQLGYGNDENVGDDETPASAGDVDVGGSVLQLAAGGSHTCALLVGNTVRCWG
jgi:alpha-tubulin suppressor-like RCC1 family protein